MTSTQRAVVAILAMVLGAALIIIGFAGGTNPDGTINGNSVTLITSGFSMVTAVLGFAFGNQNGEKRLANALAVLDAETRVGAGAATGGAAAPAPTQGGGGGEAGSVAGWRPGAPSL